MASKFSTGLVTKMLDTASLKSIFNNVGGSPAGLLMDIYSGVQPTAADDIPNGTLLATISSSGDGTGATFDAAAANGVIAKTPAETWTGTALASGTAGWFRVRRAQDTGTTASSTESRIDGAIATSGAQLNVGSLTVSAGAPFVVTSFTVTLPKA